MGGASKMKNISIQVYDLSLVSIQVYDLSLVPLGGLSITRV